MNKIIKSLCGLGAAFLLTISLTGCEKNETVEQLSLRGYTTNFVVGDEFSSKGLLVEALTGDGTINVSDEATIDSSMVNMAKPGTYAVIVSYLNISEPYYITVSPAPNEQRLISLVADTSSVKLNYVVGEEFDSSNLALIATYQNSNDEPNETKYLTDLSEFDIIVRDAEDLTVTGPFTSNGTYTVHITSGAVRTSFNINVTNVITSLDEAINSALANKGVVAGGTSNLQTDSSLNYPYLNTSVIYNMGEDLINLAYTLNKETYYECYMLKDGMPYGYKVNETTGVKQILDNVLLDNVYGLNYSFGSSKLEFIGAEEMLAGLYEIGLTNTNNDFSFSHTSSSTDTDGIEHSFNFSFGYLESPSTNTYNYYTFDVSFDLADAGSGKNYLSNLTITCNKYEVNSVKTDFTIVPRGEVGSNAFYEPNRNIPAGYPNDFPVITEGYDLSDVIARLKVGAKPTETYTYRVSQYHGTRTASSKYPDLG